MKLQVSQQHGAYIPYKKPTYKLHFSFTGLVNSFVKTGGVRQGEVVVHGGFKLDDFIIFFL